MRRFLLTAVLVSFALTALVVAQQSSLSWIRGTVKDSSGKVLAGVTVTLVSSVLPDNTVSTATDSTGQYAFGDLAPGTYTIRFALAGYATVERPPFRMLGGFNARIDAALTSETAR